jgi:hypothetical protein
MRKYSSSIELTALASTVAMATPSTSIPITITKNKLAATFSIPPITRQIRGVLVLPLLRNIADSKL